MQDEPLMGKAAIEAWHSHKEMLPAPELDALFNQPPPKTVEEGKSDIDTQVDLICEVCEDIKQLLIGKHMSYGGAAFEDVTVAGRVIPAEDAILVRMGDKIRRLTKGREYESENSIQDLAGYAILLMAVRKGKTL